jgi:hypothetical protein
MELILNDKRTIAFFLIHIVAEILMIIFEYCFINLEKYWYILLISFFGFLLIAIINSIIYLTFIFPRKYIIDFKEEE